MAMTDVKIEEQFMLMESLRTLLDMTLKVAIINFCPENILRCN